MPHSGGQDILQCVPNSLVIGPQRAGTTWILRYLEDRGDVEVPRQVKETYFFDQCYSRGMKWYASHFAGVDGKHRVIEVASTYFHSIEAPQRVWRDLGPIPLICTLRHPATRAFSLYQHLQRYGAKTRSFREAVVEEPLLRESIPYARNLRRWVDVFGRERILVMFLETLAEDPDRYARQLCDHLALPFHAVAPALRRPVNAAAMPRNRRLASGANAVANLARSLGLYALVNAAKKAGLKDLFFGRPDAAELPQLTDDDRQWFLATVKTEIEDLEGLLDRDFSEWKPRSGPSAAA